jgi:hypothetical protein
VNQIEKELKMDGIDLLPKLKDRSNYSMHQMDSLERASSETFFLDLAKANFFCSFSRAFCPYLA